MARAIRGLTRFSSGPVEVVERVYALDDPLNITAIIDGTTGAVLERYGFTGFGTPNYMDASFGSLSGSAYDWETLFASYRYDTDTGLYQVRNRFYHPNLGRWPTRDPIGYAGGINLYAYVGNNATNVTDPTGLIFLAGNKGYYGPAPTLGQMATAVGEGLAEGVAAAVVVVAVTAAAVAVGVPAAVVTGVLVIAGAVGVVATATNIIQDPSLPNIAKNVASLGGGALVAGVAARAIATKLSPVCMKPEPELPNITTELDKQWKDPSNPNSYLAGQWDYVKNSLTKTGDKNPNSTGPSTWSAGGAITGGGGLANSPAVAKQIWYGK